MDNSTNEYLEKHQIHELLNQTTESLIFHRPIRCVPHIVKRLEELKESSGLGEMTYFWAHFLLDKQICV